MGLFSSSSERRRYPRFDKPVTLSIFDENEELLDEGPSLNDICKKGMGFQTIAELKPGEAFGFRMDLPGAGTVSGIAKARWISPGPDGFTHVCGAEIDRIKWSQSRLLRRYLNPTPASWMHLFDMLLAFVFIIVITSVMNDMQAHNINLLSRFAGHVDGILEWMPQVVLSVGALLGIVVYIRNR